jgi:hypothetical protein
MVIRAVKVYLSVEITVRPQPANPPASWGANAGAGRQRIAAVSASNFSIGLPAWRRANTQLTHNTVSLVPSPNLRLYS